MCACWRTPRPREHEETCETLRSVAAGQANAGLIRSWMRRSWAHSSGVPAMERRSAISGVVSSMPRARSPAAMASMTFPRVPAVFAQFQRGVAGRRGLARARDADHRQDVGRVLLPGVPQHRREAPALPAGHRAQVRLPGHGVRRLRYDADVHVHLAHPEHELALRGDADRFHVPDAGAELAEVHLSAAASCGLALSRGRGGSQLRAQEAQDRYAERGVQPAPAELAVVEDLVRRQRRPRPTAPRCPGLAVRVVPPSSPPPARSCTAGTSQACICPCRLGS